MNRKTSSAVLHEAIIITLVGYLLFSLLDLIRTGFVSGFIDLNWFLYFLLLLSALNIFIPYKDTEKKRLSGELIWGLSGVLSVFVFLFLQEMTLIAIISSVSVFYISSSFLGSALGKKE